MTVNEVKRTLAVCLFAVTAMVIGGFFHLHAQVGDISETKRKAKVLVKPQYPELAKKLNLTGVVKIELTIGADGRVKRAHVVGGHPVLASEAEKAALQSEFEPGPKETTEVIEFKFSQQQ
ncbi:MAG TPA: energy transducer TonB [Candidatus Acidoferrum sp.]|nr:energy transducer TonB [Candidatus Acidoferrum sp.]